MSLQSQLAALITSIGTDIKGLQTTASKWTPVSVASNASPSINTDLAYMFYISSLAVAVTSFTTNLTGTPVNGQKLWIFITDNGTPRALAWGSKFEASTVALPTTTVASTRLDVGFVWNAATSKWRCVAVA